MPLQPLWAPGHWFQRYTNARLNIGIGITGYSVIEQYGQVFKFRLDIFTACGRDFSSVVSSWTVGSWPLIPAASISDLVLFNCSSDRPVVMRRKEFD